MSINTTAITTSDLWLDLDPANAKVAVGEALLLREDLLAKYLVGEGDVLLGHPQQRSHVALVVVVERLVDAGYVRDVEPSPDALPFIS